VKAVLLAWHGIACLVFLFAGWVAHALAAGQLDPLGSASYGVVVSWRADVLFALLAALQVVCLGDAAVLARRRRRWRVWSVLAVVVLVMPLSLVVGMAQIDLWRHDRHSASANVVAGALMGALIGLVYLLRRRAWAAR
jgi:hypothetical protein